MLSWLACMHTCRCGNSWCKEVEFSFCHLFVSLAAAIVKSDGKASSIMSNAYMRQYTLPDCCSCIVTPYKVASSKAVAQLFVDWQLFYKAEQSSSVLRQKIACLVRQAESHGWYMAMLTYLLRASCEPLLQALQHSCIVSKGTACGST